MGETIENFKKYTNIKILYFIQFASLSCFQPFISIYLFHFKSIPPSIIGIITCLIPFLSFVASPIWTGITDRYQCQKTIIVLNSVLSTVCLLLLIPNGDNLIGIFILIGLYSIISSPICPIVDSLVLKELGEDSKLYGMQRLFGAISYGAIAFSTGIVIQKFGLKYLYVIYGFWMAIFLIYYVFNQTERGTKFKKSMSNKSLSNFKKLINENLIELEEKQQVQLEKEIETKPHIQAIVDKEQKMIFNSNSSLGSIVSNSSYDNLESSGCSSMSNTPPVSLKRNSNIISSNDLILSNEKENEIILDKQQTTEQIINSNKNNKNNHSDNELLEQELSDEINSLVSSSNNNSLSDFNEHLASNGIEMDKICSSSSNAILYENKDGKQQLLVKDGADYAVCDTEIPIQDEIIPERLSGKEVALNLVRNPQMIIFLMACMICGMTANIISNFLFLFLHDVKHASTFLLGSTMPFTVLMELPFFFAAKDLLHKLGITNMIIIGHAAFILRLSLYNILALDSITPWLVLPIETLHGISFATIWTAGVELCNQMAPKGYETTYQGIFSGIFGGLGAGLGSIIGGFLYEHKSPMFLFRFTAITTCISLLCFSLSQLYFSKRNKNSNISINRDSSNFISAH